MCMNCGCGLPHEEHGKPANITLEELRRAGDVNGQSLRESAQHILEAVEQLESTGPGEGALAQPAGPGGAAGAGRGTPGSES